MRYCKRTIFNTIFQPHRIGRAMRYKSVRLDKKKIAKRTTMQKERRAHVGWRNMRINKFAIISRLKIMRTFTIVKRGGSYIFVKRARYYEST